MIRLVILDFDDTIVDNRKIDYQAFVISFRQLGVHVPSQKQIIQLRRNGKLAREIALKFFKSIKKQHLIDKFLKIRSQFLHSGVATSYLCLKPKTRSLLNMLKRSKTKCVLCSVRANKQTVLKFLAKNKILKYFHDVVLMEDLGFVLDNSNPSNRTLIKSSLIHDIIKKNRIKPDEAIFVGNSVEDLEASKDMKTPFIYYQNSYLEELSDNTTIKVTNMTDLQKKIHLIQRRSL